MVTPNIVAAFIGGLFSSVLVLAPIMFRVYRMSRENRAMLRLLIQAHNGINTEDINVDDIYP